MKKNPLSVIALILALVSLALCGMTISASWAMADRYDAQLAWMNERYSSLESRLEQLEAQPELPVPAPTEPAATEPPADSLRYGNLILGQWDFSRNTLTIGSAFSQVVAENAAIDQAVVSVMVNEEVCGSVIIDMAPGEAGGSWEQDLSGLLFGLPELHAGDAIQLLLEVTLSDGTAITACGGSWEYQEDQLLLIAG